MKTTILALPLLLVFSLTSPSHACFWDKDTLTMEKRRFPKTIELMTGKFVRHSVAFYRWRIEDRRAKLAENPNTLTLMDDLGVALDKTGAHDEAIALGKKALALDEARYETHANLGTFLIHGGQFAEGLVHIKKAIAINPDAHFGREIVQQHLVEYVLDKRKKGIKGLPLRRSCIDKNPRLTDPLAQLADTGRHYLSPRSENLCYYMYGPEDGFAYYAKEKGLTQAEALKGVLGMMRFSNHTHPILLEVLGDLLIGTRSGKDKHDAKQLAARAFLAASWATEAGPQQRAYRAKAALALVTHRISVTSLEKQLRREMKSGTKYFGRIEKNEARWIKSGKDPEKAFDRKYNRKQKKRRKAKKR